MPTRLFLGGTFLFAGLQKLADPHFLDAARPTSIQGQLALFGDTSPIGALLGPAQDHAVAVGLLTAVAEIAVGLGTLLGLWARIAAAGGFLLATSFFLTVSFHTRPYYYGADLFVMVMWLPLIAVGAAGVLSVDASVRRRAATDAGADPAGPVGADAHPATAPSGFPRRVLVRGGIAAAAAAVATGVLAGAAAALGRLLGGGDNGLGTVAASPTPTPTSTGSGAGSAPATTSGATTSGATPSRATPAGSPGTRVAAVADVPVGGAVRFTDPKTGQPAYVVQPTAGQYRAFNGICSHAGCTVKYAGKEQRFVCPCHASYFEAATGAVMAGPAPRGLTPVAVRAVNGQIEVPKS